MKRWVALFILLLSGGLARGAEAPKETRSAEQIARESGIHYIYFLNMSHQNISYNAPRDDTEVGYKRIIDDAIRYCDESPDFTYTFEGTWMLEKWLEQTSEPEKVNHLMDLIRQGRMELSASYGTMGTGYYNAEQVRRYTLPALVLRDKYKIPVETFINIEIPGFTQALPQVCAQTGVRYFYHSRGWNIKGEGQSLTYADLPFWWEGQAGEKVLTWIQKEEYVDNFFFANLARFFGSPAIKPGMTDQQFMEQEIAERLAKYQAAGYKWDAILVSYCHDNSHPGAIYGYLPQIREWNRTHTYPQIILCTPRQFFRRMEEKYDRRFPTYAGDWSSSWLGDGKINRWTKNHFFAAEALSNINAALGGRRSLLEDFPGILRLTLEATGSHFGGVDEHLGFTELARRNLLGTEPLRQARIETAALLYRGLDQLAGAVAADKESVLVYNPCSWRRSGPVTFTVLPPLWKRDIRLQDPQSGAEVPLEKAADSTSFTFIARDVPPLGYKLYTIVESGSAVAPAALAEGPQIENEFYRVRVNPADGSVASIWDKQAKRELLNPKTQFPLGRLSGASHMDMFFGNPPTLLPPIEPRLTHLAGATQETLRVSWDAGPISGVELRLWKGLKRVELGVKVEAARLPLPDKEGRAAQFLSFPLNIALPGAEFRYESNGGFLNLSEQAGLLPGAFKGSFVAQYAYDVRQKDGWGIMFAPRDSGALTFGAAGPVFTLDGSREPTFFVGLGSRTPNYPGLCASLDGLILPGIPEALTPDAPTEIEYWFALGSSLGRFDPVATMRFGREFSLPLLARRLGANPRGTLPAAPHSFFSIEPDNVVIEAIKQPEFGEPGDLLVRVQETAGRPAAQVTLGTPFKVSKVELDNLEERPSGKRLLGLDHIAFSMKANESVTVRLEVKREG